MRSVNRAWCGGAILLAAATSSPGQHFNPFNGRVYSLTPTRMTWWEAQACGGQVGGTLATMTDEGEQHWVLDRLAFGGDYNVWLGGRDQGTGQWVWVTGEPFGPGFWMPPYPVTRKEETFTLLIVNGSERGAWYNGAGGAMFYGIIETCYANCDESSTPPVLNVGDFICFLNRFAEGHSLANCDGSTVPPILNVSDFICFRARFTAGCS
jgi:hypothetical protein